MSEVTVVKEITKGNRIFKEMSDGTVCVESVNKPTGTLYGDYVMIDGLATEEKISNAKEALVANICDMIRKIANARDDFFIIKEMDGCTTVAHKFILPTVEESPF